MSGSGKTTPIDLDKALLDPASVFETPEAVEGCAQLSSEQRIEILRRWEYDASEGAVATEEGMPDGENDLLRRVLLALDRLAGDVDVAKTGPTKQEGLTRDAVRKH